jgi:DNA-binding MarR family transcriptional regulator
MQEPRSLVHLLAQVCHLNHGRAREHFRALGLYRGQPPVLDALSEQEGRTQSEIADYLHVAPATVTKMLQRMEHAGFVERRPDPADQRVSRVYLTDQGRAVHGRLRDAFATWSQETFVGLSERERDELWRMLAHIRENLLAVMADDD